ncbi:DUF2637 domain-containing protein [Streptomyces sp. YIM 98790]|uniref:DUF2637 domain-containing protein n=1 Tax=Streptomyces sp. YIM 98790 TaxID=2689077 RepID=UPI00140E6472|nr:DUF2637 domain-containing protein [Streptomyces sp. YIM 98790]
MSERTMLAPPALGRWERWLLGAAIAAGVAVGALGLASSFEALSAAARAWGFAHPWMLPVGIDVAIPVFTLAHLLLIRMDMRLAWVRIVPWALTAVTCWLNIAAGTSFAAKLAHGTMPLLWVVLSEIAAHVYAVRIGAVTGRRMERIRRSRWLLAPLSTFALWRRMVLWETTSYTTALARERERLLARAELRETYGRAWRRRAPRSTRVLLKLGEANPEPAATDTGTPAPVICDGGGLPTPAVPTGRRRAENRSRPRPAAGRTTRSKGAKGRGRRTDAELLAEARQITADWPETRITAEAVREALRIAPARARALREMLRAERAAPDATAGEVAPAELAAAGSAS